MKILQLIRKHQNRGAETFSCQLINHLNQLGHKIKIVSIFDGVVELIWVKSLASIDSNHPVLPTLMLGTV